MELISEITLPDLPLYANKRRRICCFGYRIGLRKTTGDNRRSAQNRVKENAMFQQLRTASRNGGRSMPATVYRIAIHQKKGAGTNAVLEGFLATGDTTFSTPFASSGTQTFTTRADSVQIGASTPTGVTLTFDDIRLDTGAMPGPSVP